MTDKFKTLKDMMDDPKFIQFIRTETYNISHRRSIRPMPKEGYKYRRDVIDRMIDSDQLNPDFVFNNIESVLSKKSNLSSEIRKVINYIASVAIHETLVFYTKDIPDPASTQTTTITNLKNHKTMKI